MSRLERRYRALLRILPGWYRAEHEEEMVTSFLDGRPDDMDAEYGWPGWSEAAATVALSAQLRLRGDAGDTVRLAALIGLVIGVAMAGSEFTMGEFVPFSIMLSLLPAFALIALTRKAWSFAKVLVGIPLLPGLITFALSFSSANWLFGPVLALALLLPWLTIFLLVCMGFTGDQRVSGHWLWAAAIAAGVGAAVPLAGVNPLMCAPFALLVVAIVKRSRVWTVAAAVNAALLLPYAIFVGPPAWIAAALTVSAVLVRPRRRSVPRAA